MLSYLFLSFVDDPLDINVAKMPPETAATFLSFLSLILYITRSKLVGQEQKSSFRRLKSFPIQSPTQRSSYGNAV